MSVFQAPLAERTPVRDAGLLSIADACARAARYVEPLRPVENVPLLGAIGRTLAEAAIARLPMPPFTQSAMDGYALAAG